MTNTRQWHLDATLAATAAVLCQPVAWPRFLPHVPHAALRPDGMLTLTTAWRGVRIPTVCSVEQAQGTSAFTLTLRHQSGLLRGLTETWLVQEGATPAAAEPRLTLRLTTWWAGDPLPLHRRPVARVYIDGVLPRTAAQLVILAESDWRSRGIYVLESS